ncbi:hypothetical protein ACWOAH_08100 [Vagococcus vulneris]|uniref:Uncharacterized protein n=1 Tax=Vagococcus vulneris TaxID=1977869 RepID=A0A429ZWU7_9ENTE|nr:hypothetical protein [Vagococcus vulneris]RST98195.1 hypothetical protein CBF37_08480 [Vagococcus vulneris]
MYRKEKKSKIKNDRSNPIDSQSAEKPSKKDSEPQILTRESVRAFKKNKKRNTWLNMAIIIVGILLAITIYAVFRL